jgi:hypothetical protein
VEIHAAETSGWDVFYCPPRTLTVVYNSWGEDWDAALDYGELYGVVWEGGYAR